MIFRQVIQEDLGCASYFVGDHGSGRAAVIDPRFDIGVYLELAERFNLEITDVLETHTHADHVSGHGRLASLCDATIHVHEEAGADYPHQSFAGGDEIELGDVVIRALHTPGHRPEHTAFALIDRARSEKPWALVSGDSLLVGDVARPDLAVEKDEGAALIHSSLHGLLDGLAPETELWPGHVGGSTCGSAGIDMKSSSTLGYEQANNEVLGFDRDHFVEAVLGELGPQPANFKAIVAINRGPLLTSALDPESLDAEGLKAQIDTGTIAIDVRDSSDFDSSHATGAVSIPVAQSGFATALGESVGDVPFVIIGSDEGQARRAVLLAEAVGLRQVAGVLAGGFEAWREAGLPTQSITELQPGELAERLDEGEMQVLDVRTAGSFEKASIPGSINADYTDISRIPDGIDADRPVAVVCGRGWKSGIAASLLQRAGAPDVFHVNGGGAGDVLEKTKTAAR